MSHFRLVAQARLQATGFSQLAFKLAPVPGNLAHLLFSAFPAPGLLSQSAAKLSNLLLYASLGCQQFLNARFESGLVGAGTVLLCLQLFSRLLEVPAQLRLQAVLFGQLCLEFAPLFGSFTHLLFGAFSAAGLFGQSVGELSDL